MVMQRRSRTPLLTIAAAASAFVCLAQVASWAFVGGGGADLSQTTRSRVQGSGSASTSRSQGAAKTALLARGGDDGEADTVEVGGFAGFVVGLALLPYVLFTLYTVFDISVQGQSFGIGPYGLELVSVVTSLGLTLWSLGSFVQRGRGLPAGPLGLLGLAEGLSYLAALGLLAAGASTVLKASKGFELPTLPSPSSLNLPKLPDFKVPDIKVPDIKVPNFQAPDFKAPDFKAPDFKAPDIKVPDFKSPDFKLPDFKVPDFKAPAFSMPDIKMPDIKMPDIKVPDVKMPDIKVPDIKVPEMKLPELPKPAPAAEKPKPEPEKPKPAPASTPANPAAKKQAAPDYAELFD